MSAAQELAARGVVSRADLIPIDSFKFYRRPITRIEGLADEATEALAATSLLPPLVRLIVAYGGFGETCEI